jgi:hypothetical protein
MYYYTRKMKSFKNTAGQVSITLRRTSMHTRKQ